MGQFNPFICGLNNASDNGVGKSISTITFTSSTGGITAGIAGATDTYEITYTDGSKSNFIVTNGRDGQNGQDGQDGTSILSVTLDSTEGLVDTYIIRYSDGSTSYFSVTNGQNALESEEEVAIQNTQPKEESIKIWIDPTEQTEIQIIELEDDSISKETTWSSFKISQELEKIKNNTDNTSNIVNLLDSGTLNFKGIDINSLKASTDIDLNYISISGVYNDNDKAITDCEITQEG